MWRAAHGHVGEKNRCASRPASPAPTTDIDAASVVETSPIPAKKSNWIPLAHSYL
jgi:hypothetical protein